MQNNDCHRRHHTVLNRPRLACHNGGFTIVELLVVIVVIGILATITIATYTGITQKAIASSIKSDLTNASNQLKMFQVENSKYPTSVDCGSPDSTTNKCVKTSPGTIFDYQVDNLSNPQLFSLYATNGAINYRVTSAGGTSPVATALVCPINFVIVPGSGTYGTSDFCVMKYEARRVGSTATPISLASGYPWVSVSQTSAIANSPNVAGCTGCHLITEAEWLTIAQNVLYVPSNWSSGTVGSGYIYSGHSDNSPASALSADTNDSNGYLDTGNSSGTQRRTLSLSNGEVIWDFAGNVWECTSGQLNSGQPGISGNGANWREWTALTVHGTLLPDPFPSTTGISGSGTWNSSNGIGQIYSDSDAVALRAYFRGGVWQYASVSGVMALDLSHSPTFANTPQGFRVAR